MKRPCLEQGCPRLTERTRCLEHERQRERTRRPSPSQRGYDREWRRLSAELREGGWCARCGTTADLTVDHIVPGTLAGGLRVLCRRCHGEVGAQRNRR